MERRRALALAACVLMIAVAAWATYAFWPRSGQRVLTISTTTSLYATGFLDHLAEIYKARKGVELRFIAVGTGQALEIASHGEADGVLVHAPVLEAKFLAEGHGACRKIIAYNFFIIVGPPDDPAGIRGCDSPTEAFKRIADAGRAGKAIWVSRGDMSGTHVRELQIWNATAREFGDAYDIYKHKDEWVSQGWYREAGAGMGATLRMANELGAYTLVDTGTYARYRQEGLVELVPLVEKGRELLNVYSAIATNPEKHPGVDFEGFLELIKFLVSEEGQELFAEYKIGGEPAFYPAVRVLKEDVEPIASWIREVAFIGGEECPRQYRLGHEELYQDCPGTIGLSLYRVLQAVPRALGVGGLGGDRRGLP